MGGTVASVDSVARKSSSPIPRAPNPDCWAKHEEREEREASGVGEGRKGAKGRSSDHVENRCVASSGD